ncbi:ferritin-like domain-containing protein [Halobacterium wangiae]|uniref:YciE/YciF ferroxidase family protein n=1 Tax=Halobacterium wangiae TaxID=2902623 RepID=UPI001E5E305C|nr:DUF892 family protein [Halobacterium wangiae]
MSAPRLTNLGDQFVYELEAVYDMEVKLVEALGELSYMATNDKLSEGFATHRDETKAHVERVESAFQALGREPSRRDNLVVDALLEEKAQYDESVVDDDLRNVHYLTAGMKTERIEISNYEGLLTTAKKAGLGDEVTDPLEENLDDEENALRKLEGLSTGSGLKALWTRLTS